MANIDLDAIQARHGEWYGGVDYIGPGPDWTGQDRGEASDHYIVRADVPALIAEVRRLRADVATGHAMVLAERALTLAVMDVTE